MAGRKFQIGNVSLYIVEKDYSYLCMRITTLAGKKHNLDPMWKLLNKEVDLGEPTSFLDHVYLEWPGGWGPQGMSQTGGGGLARVPNLCVCKHPLVYGVAHAGREG